MDASSRRQLGNPGMWSSASLSAEIYGRSHQGSDSPFSYGRIMAEAADSLPICRVFAWQVGDGWALESATLRLVAGQTPRRRAREPRKEEWEQQELRLAALKRLLRNGLRSNGVTQ